MDATGLRRLPDMSDPGERARAIHATLLPGFTGTSIPPALRSRLKAGLGGVCVFGPNIVSLQQLRELNDDILREAPLAVIAIDEEGGDVTRLNYADGSPFPGNAVLGRIDDLILTERTGAEVGWSLRRTSCTLDFAPDVDVNSNPDNPVIGVRSFGSDAAQVARHGAAWAAGIQATGVAACAKHFPGHGDTALDSHLALPVIDRSLDELRERELVPFAAAIQAGVASIMTSHIVLPQVDPGTPATFSSPILQGLLRHELGFEGLIVTDALDMKGASGEIGIPEAAVRALAAGSDLLCLGTDTADDLIGAIVDAVEDAIASGRLSAERVADAAARVDELAARLAEARAVVPESAAREIWGSPADLEPLAASFDVRDDVVRFVHAAERDFSVVRIETEANIAVGVAPWGPFAQLIAEPEATDSLAWARHPEFVVSESDAEGGDLEERIADVLSSVPQRVPVVVIGKAMHRYPFARATVDELRARRATLVVDMGWPSDDRRYADVATFGASRTVGRALMALLDGSVSAGRSAR